MNGIKWNEISFSLMYGVDLIHTSILYHFLPPCFGPWGPWTQALLTGVVFFGYITNRFDAVIGIEPVCSRRDGRNTGRTGAGDEERVSSPGADQ